MSKSFYNTSLCHIAALVVALSLPLSLAAQDSLRVIHLTNGVNTVGNESAPTPLNGNKILFSYLPHDASEHRLELDGLLMQIMEGTVDADGQISNPRAITKGLNSSSEHTGNAAYDKNTHRLYFTRCEVTDDGRNPCAIYTAVQQGGNWRNVTKMKGDINLSGYTSTQPAVAYLDGQTILFFSSNRPGGQGGMDIWYTIVDGAKSQEVINLGMPVNSGYDEITPFYDMRQEVLYFSSDRTGGFGGYDIYASHGSRNSFCKPVPLDRPFNSNKNDIYYVISNDNGNQGYLASNRAGALFTVDSFCCNDIFLWEIDTLALAPKPDDNPDKGSDVVADNPPSDNPPVSDVPSQPYAPSQPDTPKPVARTLPVLPDPPVLTSVQPTEDSPIVLYFHNDEPDPGSHSANTAVSYDETVDKYLKMRPRYKAAWASVCDKFGCDSAAMILDYFFDYEVKFNYDRLNDFIWMMAEELWNDHKVTLTVRGFASPLHTKDYNATLSQRRIECLLNYLRKWNSGNLRHSIAEGMLQIIEAPYGSNSAPKNVSSNFNDAVHSVYSVEAARERRVEIIKVVSE